jgi:hypothetical protein
MRERQDRSRRQRVSTLNAPGQHTRQFRDPFIEFMKENYTTDVSLGAMRAAG